MARGNAIIVSADPRGRFMEGRVSGTPKPGTCMQIKTSSGMGDDGRFTYEVYAPGADGEQREVIILLPDQLQGRLATDAYADGERCFLYTPRAGEEFNMLLKDVAGTADDHAFGDVMMIDTSTGKLVATTSTPESEAFKLLETVTDPAADQLVHVQYTGY
jgi:hypothetical protein